MKLLNTIFICALLLPGLLSCKKEKAEEWFVIEKNGSMRDSITYIGGNGFYSSVFAKRKNNDTNDLQIHLYHAPVKHWYCDFQIILDSDKMVYVFETEKLDHTKKIRTDEDLSYQYSNYIGLRPEHLLAFDSKYFVDFLKANNDIFGFDINDRDSAFMAVIATTTDTIKNPVLYQLRDLIKGSKNKTFLIRKTSEEENVVLYHKRRHIPFHPEQWRWSTHFLDGKHRPFTSSYDSLEHNTAVVFKAAPGIKRQIKKVRHIQ